MTYGNAVYGGASYGGEEDTVKYRHQHPWAINRIRIEAILSDNGIPAIVPGESASYTLALSDKTLPNIAPIEARYERLLEYIETSAQIVTWQTDRGAYYRNQGEGDQLVCIKPIEPGVPATGDPPIRDSDFEGRWAVVTGGEDLSRFPASDGEIQLETVTIASLDQFETRESVKQQRGRTGI